MTEREEEKLSRVQIENGREGLEVLLKTLASCNVPGTLRISHEGGKKERENQSSSLGKLQRME